MSSKKKQEIAKEEKDWNRVDDVVFKSESFLLKNQKIILGVIGIAAIIVCGFFAYKTFYLTPKTEEAQVAIFRGEQYFQNQQDSLALYGDGNGYLGFISIINEYGSTKPGDLAKYYAGICYARTGKYEEAINYLKDFKGGDELLTYAAKGAIGDCLVNTGKTEEAIKYYMDAAKGSDNALTSPANYKKAAMVYRDMKNYDKVIELYTLIKNNYMTSMEASEADLYIDEANLLKGKN